MATNTVSSIQPNLRFGASFLDSSKYRDRGTNGETMMDKRTGEVVLKRKEDGSLIYFDRENMRLDDYISNIRAITRSDIRYRYPTIYNTKDTENIFFETFLLDTQDFIPEDSDLSYCDGIKYGNPLINTRYVDSTTDDDGNITYNTDKGFSIAKETNGIIVKIMARPRDSALVEFCANAYDKYYKNYTGTDSSAIAEKNKYTSIDKYDSLNVEITYNINAISKDGGSGVARSMTSYAKLNEWSLLLFLDESGNEIIKNPDDYSEVKVTIVSVRLPKIKGVEGILDSLGESAKRTYKKLLDDSSLDETANNGRIAITHTYISAFIRQDTSTLLPDPRNSKVIELVPLSAFNESLRTIGNVASIEGVHVSPEQPDEQTRLSISVWAERIRDVYAKGVTEDLEGHTTNISDLESLFGSAESIDGDIKMETDTTDKDYMWRTIKTIKNTKVPSWLIG